MTDRSEFNAGDPRRLPVSDPLLEEVARLTDATEAYQARDTRRIAVNREQVRSMARYREEIRALRRELEAARAWASLWRRSARRWRGSARRAALVLESVSRSLDLTGRPWRRPGHPRSGV